MQDELARKPGIAQNIANSRDYGNMPSALVPLANLIDEVTGGWGLSYADLSPDTEKTPAGISFLLTNVLFIYAGYMLAPTTPLLGFCAELAGIVSWVYHYTQLKEGQDSQIVRLSLLLDYIVAGFTILVGLTYILQDLFVYKADFFSEALIQYSFASGALAFACICAGWVYEYGRPYIFWHGLWHVFSALACYLVGLEHANILGGS
jgi:hypothetical protein